jgi:PleD family two-component response regulator
MDTNRVLIAEDDTELLANVALHLRNQEYTVVTAADGYKALTAAQREEPDVLLVGVGVMVDEYNSLCDELRHHSALKHIPVVYMIDDRSVRLGNVPRVPSRFLVYKPVHTGDLFQKIELAIKGGNMGHLGIDSDWDHDGGQEQAA